MYMSSDNDPVQFWTYVIAALDKLHPGIDKIPLSLPSLRSQEELYLVVKKRDDTVSPLSWSSLRLRAWA